MIAIIEKYKKQRRRGSIVESKKESPEKEDTPHFEEGMYQYIMWLNQDICLIKVNMDLWKFNID